MIWALKANRIDDNDNDKHDESEGDKQTIPLINIATCSLKLWAKFRGFAWIGGGGSGGGGGKLPLECTRSS